MEQPQSGEFTDAPLVGTASTWYNNPNEVRFEVALQAAEAYRNANIPYVVIDASPDADGDWVAAAHRERGAIVLRADVGGIASQRQQGVKHAIEHGAQKVVGAEPEKPAVPLFASEISVALDRYDVLVIGRTQTAEDSLPPTQQRTERLAGWILERTHTLPPDALAGPRGFTAKGAAVLAEYKSIDPETGKSDPKMNTWLYLYETPLTARRQGLPIGGLPIEMIYPDATVAEETDNPVFDKKRYDQFTMQLDHLLGPGFSAPDMRSDSRLLALHARDAVWKIAAAEPDQKPEIFGRLETLMATQYGYEPAERLRVQ